MRIADATENKANYSNNRNAIFAVKFSTKVSDEGMLFKLIIKTASLFGYKVRIVYKNPPE